MELTANTAEAQPPSEPLDARIVLDARYICDHTSGIGRYTENLIRELLALDPDLRLSLITDPGKPRADLDDHSEIERVAFQTYPAEPNSLRTRFRMASALDLEGDFFHSPFNILPGGLDMPSVFTLHDIMWLLDVNYCTDSWWRKIVTGTFYQQLIPRSVEEASHIMTVSHTSREAIEDYFPRMKGRVHVSYNGVDPFFSPVEHEEAWDRIDKWVPREKRFVLVVGQGSPYKNHAGAIGGFLEAFGDDPDVHFVIVRRLSRGPATEFHQLMDHPSIRDRTLQLEHVSGQELLALYSAAHAFLFPSFYEGFGLPALEAMACGTPVVTANVGAPDEIGGDAAVKVDPHDRTSIAEGLRSLFDDDDFWAERRKAGLERAAEFTWARCARQTHEVYRKMLQET